MSVGVAVGALGQDGRVPTSQPKNRLFYGDNLEVLRRDIASQSVDLIYLDPPFNSNRSYNVLFKQKTGSEAQAQICLLYTSPSPRD